MNCFVFKFVLAYPQLLVNLLDGYLTGFIPTKMIDLVSDTIASPSIKDCERERRGRDGLLSYKISVPNMKLPPNLVKELRNYSFKRELISFLIVAFEDGPLIEILGEKT